MWHRFMIYRGKIGTTPKSNKSVRLPGELALWHAVGGGVSEVLERSLTLRLPHHPPLAKESDRLAIV